MKPSSWQILVLAPLGTILFGFAPAAAAQPDGEKPPLWRDPAQPLELRARDLVGRMTLEEKARQVCNEAPSIPRLGLPAYDYWNDSLHGIGRNGTATVFPQAIGMAASFDLALLHRVADAIPRRRGPSTANMPMPIMATARITPG